MPYLTVFLLGSPRIERDGMPVAVHRRKAIALMAYLAIANEGHKRDALAGLLWPECDQNAAHAALSTTLGALKAVDRNLVSADRETVRLNRASFWVDVDHLDSLLAGCQTHGHPADQVCAACLPLLAEAIALYRGDFLAGFTLRDSASFDDWQLFQTESLRRQAAYALEKLVRGHSAQGEFEQAVAYARRWLALEPFHEPAHRQLMQLYAWLGQPAAALRQYQECARLLAQELDLRPHEATSRLYQDIQNDRLPPPPAFPDAGPAALRHHNLPAQPTPFFGREKELAEIARQLQGPSCRLLTITGPGGIGKTRLAIQAAAQNAPVFSDGICFVSLASLSSTDLLAPTLADALQFPLQGGADPQAQLLHHLRERKMLLVLDNLEHLVEGTAPLADILSFAPGIKMLVTSRESLGLQWEWSFPVQGLDFPQDSNISAIESYSAVQLFIQSARQVHPHLALSEEEKPCVARICRYLEGMPLGIELAAAWTQSLSCREIAQEIERDLDFLATCLRDVPQRHRSLRAVFDHSWSLLSEMERHAFSKLAVFRGGFGREAAERVAGASLPLLVTLMRKSFLRKSPTGRYEMLEVLRQYAEEKLHQTPHEEDQTRHLHCAYYAEFLHRREEQLHALEEIAEEIENVRAAWQWAIAHKKVKEIGQSLESLYLFYERQGWLQEGEEAFGKAVEMLAGIKGVSDSLSEEQGIILGQALARQGRVCVYRSRFSKARKLLQESLAILRRFGARSEMAFPLSALGNVAWSLGDYVESRQFLEESLAIHKENNDRWGIARCLNSLGIVAARSGEYVKTGQLHQESLAICQEIGDRRGMAVNLTNLGVNAGELGEYLEARRLYQEALAIFKELGDQPSIANCINNLGYVLYTLEKDQEARQCWQEALETALDALSVSAALQALVGMVLLLTKEGKREQALELITRTLAHPAIYGEMQDGAEQILSELEFQLFHYFFRHPAIHKELEEIIREIKDRASSSGVEPNLLSKGPGQSLK